MNREERLRRAVAAHIGVAIEDMDLDSTLPHLLRGPSSNAHRRGMDSLDLAGLTFFFEETFPEEVSEARAAALLEIVPTASLREVAAFLNEATS